VKVWGENISGTQSADWKKNHDNRTTWDIQGRFHVFMKRSLRHGSGTTYHVCIMMCLRPEMMCGNISSCSPIVGKQTAAATWSGVRWSDQRAKQGDHNRVL